MGTAADETPVPVMGQGHVPCSDGDSNSAIATGVCEAHAGVFVVGALCLLQCVCVCVFVFVNVIISQIEEN